jgi:uncharacterized protein (TIGR03084 family)
MRPEIEAFQAEVEELDALLETLRPGDWAQATPFKGWTPWDVLAHLHWTDAQAMLALTDVAAFRDAGRVLREATGAGRSLMDYTRDQLAGVDAVELRQRWSRVAGALCEALEQSDPTARLPWYGPDMGTRMFATARQMETWAHAQDIYDLLGRERVYDDRLENIAVIGIKTFAWTFVNRGLEVPERKPFVRLTAPSGAIWTYHAESVDERIEGTAADFCHVVTQGRHVEDTGLRVSGPVARQWMSIAQCFAGGAADPPAPGARRPPRPSFDMFPR